MRPPDEVLDYRRQVTETLNRILGAALLAVYVGGSAGLGNFRISVSDLDIFAFVAEPLTEAQKHQITEALKHESLPCPAYGLDFIVYRRDQVQPVPRTPIYEMSLATGENWVDEIDLGGEYPGGLIDLAMLRERGIQEFGPPPGDFIHPVDREWLNEELLESLEWHKHHVHDRFHDPTGANAVLNACRALRYFAEGELACKSGGGEWAQREFPGYEVVAQALAMREGDRPQPLNHEDVLTFLDAVEKRAAILM